MKHKVFNRPYESIHEQHEQLQLQSLKDNSPILSIITWFQVKGAAQSLHKLSWKPFNLILCHQSNPIIR